MNRLADQGFLLFAGPLAGTEQGRVRVLLSVNADDEAEIHRRLDSDPWAERLLVKRVEPWNILVGTERLNAAEPV